MLRVGGRGAARTRPDFDHEARGGARRSLIGEVAETLQIQYDPRGALLPLRDANPGQQVPGDADCFLLFQSLQCAPFLAAVLQIEIDAIRIAKLSRPNQVRCLQLECHVGGIRFGRIVNGDDGGESGRYDIGSFWFRARGIGGCEQVAANAGES